jgi:hypothetical protein
MAHVMDVWTEYHVMERVISSSPALAAMFFSEDHGLEEANLEIVVQDHYTQQVHTFKANELNYGYAPDGGYAG